MSDKEFKEIFDDVSDASPQDVFKAISDPSRRKILKILQGGSRNAGELAQAFDFTKGSLSHDFNILKAAAISPRGFRFETFRPFWAVLEGSILGLLFLIHGLALMQGMGKPVDMNRGVAAGAGVLLVVLGNFMGKVTRNFFVGIRTPWTLASEEVWLRTHRFGGRLFVLAGLVLLVSAFLGGGWVVASIAIGLAAVLSVVYSYLIYRRVEGVESEVSGSNP